MDKCPESHSLSINDSDKISNENINVEEQCYQFVYGKRMFAYNGRRLLNVLPDNIRVENNTDNFKAKLKILLSDGYK